MSAYNCIFLTCDCIFLLISSASLFPGLSVPFQQALPQQVRVNSWWPLNVLHYRTCGAPAAAGAGRPRPAARGRGWHACARGKPLPAAVRLTGRQRGAASVAAAAASAVCCRCCSLLPGRRRWPPASIAAAVLGPSRPQRRRRSRRQRSRRQRWLDVMMHCFLPTNFIFCPQPIFYSLFLNEGDTVTESKEIV